MTAAIEIRAERLARYRAFLRAKIATSPMLGFEIEDPEIHPSLKPFQRRAVQWAVKGGRRALFEAFGLGKTRQQLEILRLILKRAGGRGLIVAPLGVRQEFFRCWGWWITAPKCGCAALRNWPAFTHRSPRRPETGGLVPLSRVMRVNSHCNAVQRHFVIPWRGYGWNNTRMPLRNRLRAQARMAEVPRSEVSMEHMEQGKTKDRDRKPGVLASGTATRPRTTRGPFLHDRHEKPKRKADEAAPDRNGARDRH